MKYIKGEVYFPIIIGLHFGLWLLDLSLYEGSFELVEGEGEAARVLGEVMSSWVVTVFGFNLLMTTRASWVERLFGGLDKMYVVHRRSGVIAAVLLLLHFGTVPRHPQFTVGKPLGFAAMVLILLGIAFAAAPLMKRKLPYHKWLAGHRLMGPFYVVGVLHALFVPTLISELPFIRTYVFFMAGVGCLSWLYRVGRGRLFARPLTYAVQAVKRHGGAVVEIELAPQGPKLDYEAGQFAFFTFDRLAPRQAHPFTVASSPSEPHLRIVVKASGDFTSELVASVEDGDVVRVDGPYGRLTLKSAGRPQQVWIAGGIGITPFLALAQGPARSERQVRLLWSVRAEGDAFFSDELGALAERDAGFDYEVWNSREQGYLSVDSAGGADAFRDKEIFICGPVALRDGFTRQLRDAGVPASRIHSEEFAFR